MDICPKNGDHLKEKKDRMATDVSWICPRARSLPHGQYLEIWLKRKHACAQIRRGLGSVTSFAVLCVYCMSYSKLGETGSKGMTFLIQGLSIALYVLVNGVCCELQRPAQQSSKERLPGIPTTVILFTNTCTGTSNIIYSLYLCPTRRLKLMLSNNRILVTE